MLVPATLEAQLVTIFSTPHSAAEAASLIAAAVDAYIKTATVTVTVPILPVQVVPVTGTGATVAPVPATGNLT